MADREDNVYRAKLAEQAERYEGKYILIELHFCAVVGMLHPGRCDEREI